MTTLVERYNKLVLEKKNEMDKKKEEIEKKYNEIEQNLKKRGDSPLVLLQLQYNNLRKNDDILDNKDELAFFFKNYLEIFKTISKTSDLEGMHIVLDDFSFGNDILFIGNLESVEENYIDYKGECKRLYTLGRVKESN